ncbi:hypothetical protein VTL71DRAFT_7070 [Oculimacula yallundae]|uniref:GH16 domain-containing protein n=1 Tax=Oculimacula yallundae TaxID=86028 RepID=A0ABR4BVN7_9HELO
MPSFSKLTALSLLLTLTTAAIPEKGGYSVLWSDDFEGKAGSKANPSIWNYETGSDLNGGIQIYNGEAQQASLTGRGSLSIHPVKRSGGNWYSARLGSWPTFTPENGHMMTVEAEIKLGQNAQDRSQGIWPAFWAVGTALYKGVKWPACGEWDIMENRNGDAGILGTIHYGADEAHHQSRGSSWQNNIDRTQFHKYAIDVDRTPASWRDESLTWKLDGQAYFTVKGSDVGDEQEWATIAHEPFYMILNVAVGGGFTKVDGSKQYPDGNTLGGEDAGMEVNYVSVYVK